MSDQEPKTYPLQDAVPVATKFVEFLTPDSILLVRRGTFTERMGSDAVEGQRGTR